MTAPSDSAGFSERLRMQAEGMAPQALRVVRFIDENRALALAGSAMDLAARTGTSDATVVRAVQALGFAGLAEMRRALVAEIGRASTPEDDMRRTLADVGDSSEHAVQAVLDTHAEALAALRTPAARGHIAAAIGVLHPAERIVVFGIGPSALLAGYTAMLLARGGRCVGTLDATGLQLADQMLDLRRGDALLALAYGRPYREVMAVFAEARRLGLKVVLVTDGPETRLARGADVVLAAQRGRAGQVALHGATLVGLEALVLGLAAADQTRAMATLRRLDGLREAVSGQRHDVGPAIG